MGEISTKKLGGWALVVGPVVSILFFLFQPGGLLVGPPVEGTAEEAVATYMKNPELMRITSIVIAIGLVTMIFGYSSIVSSLREGGKADGLARLGFTFMLVGVIGWVLVQGIHFMLANGEVESIALAAYEVDSGITRAGGMAVSIGFLLFSLGLMVKGKPHKTVGIIVAVFSAISFVSLVFGVNSPDNIDTAVAVSRACYFPWVVWSVWLGWGQIKEE